MYFSQHFSLLDNFFVFFIALIRPFRRPQVAARTLGGGGDKTRGVWPRPRDVCASRPPPVIGLAAGPWGDTRDPPSSAAEAAGARRGLRPRRPTARRVSRVPPVGRASRIRVCRRRAGRPPYSRQRRRRRRRSRRLRRRPPVERPPAHRNHPVSSPALPVSSPPVRSGHFARNPSGHAENPVMRR